uniref:Acetyltransferase 10 n=1 Tax=Helicoverpa armigera TaxID=29058 RepID=A0A291P122_HELAM|nr:acetyltransferase 10 [Helicoverpa armigera]
MDLVEHEWYIQAPWGRIAIIAWGDCCNPPVLLCHGSMDSAVSFRPLVSKLPRNYYYIGLDLPGNGKSDRFLPGLMISVYDMLYAIHALVKHFRWKTFTLIGHSFGAYLGQFYNLCYPDKLELLINLDPINFFAVPPEEFSRWYHIFFTNFYKNYDKYNTPKEKSPTIKWTEALQSLMRNRPSLNEEQAAAVLERLSEPVGDGCVRYTYDLRMKRINGPAYSPEHVKKLFTAVRTPILTIACQKSLKNKLFRNTAFLLDEAEYPGGNFRFKSVEGSHDVHISHPERVAGFIGQFLEYGVEGLDKKSKL